MSHAYAVKPVTKLTLIRQLPALNGHVKVDKLSLKTNKKIHENELNIYFCSLTKLKMIYAIATNT